MIQLWCKSSRRTFMDKFLNILYFISCVLLIIGGALGITHRIEADLTFLLGAIGYGSYYALLPSSDGELRQKRLVRMNIFASILFIVSAIARFGFLDRYGQQLWVFFLLLGLIFMVYANVTTGYTTRKRPKR